MVAASALGLAFIVLILVLVARHVLVPEIVILGSFILCVLWFTGLIGTSIQLYGSTTNVNANCQNYVVNRPFNGASINTLAWLTQINICKRFPLTQLKALLHRNPIRKSPFPPSFFSCLFYLIKEKKLNKILVPRYGWMLCLTNVR